MVGVALPSQQRQGSSMKFSSKTSFMHYRFFVVVVCFFPCKLNSQDYLWQPCTDFHDGCPDLLYMLCVLVIGNRLLFNAFLRFEGKGPFLL